MAAGQGCYSPAARRRPREEAIIFGNRRILGLSHYEAEHLRGALGLLRRTRDRYPWDRVVSHTFPLDEIDEAFAQQDRGHVTRAAIVPN